MFKNLEETIKSLNADLSNVANCDKAKKLRKKLLTIGLSMAVIGFVGVFVCFILFVTAGNAATTSYGFSAKILIPFILFIPCGIIGSIGSMIARLGLKIVITGYTANLVNETIGNCCPKCGDKIYAEEHFCSKCGAPLKKQCRSCGYENSTKCDYCVKCGEKLD